LFNQAGDRVDALAIPAGFRVTPLEAVILAKEKANFNCHHKWGAHIYADNNNYYLVAPGQGARLKLQNAFASLKAVIDGKWVGFGKSGEAMSRERRLQLWIKSCSFLDY
jgi:hypothetical protein